jgi:hypothetical protein
VERLGDGLLAGVGRQHEHLAGRRGGLDGAQRRRQVGPWHVGVEQQHHRFVLGGQLDGLVGVVGHPEHGQVVLRIEHHAESLGEHPMVVGEHQPDHVRHRHYSASQQAPSGRRQPVLRPSCKAPSGRQRIRPLPRRNRPVIGM